MPMKTRKNRRNKSTLRGGVSHAPHKTRYLNKYKLGRSMHRRRFAAKPGQPTTENIIMKNLMKTIRKTPRASTRNLRKNKEASGILVKLVDEFILKDEANGNYANEEYDKIIRRLSRAARKHNIRELAHQLGNLSEYHFEDRYFLPNVFINDARAMAADLRGSAKIEADADITALMNMLNSMEL